MTTQPSEVIPQWSLGDRLNKALHHAGISIAEMADELGVSRNTIGNYVNDRTRIPRAALMVWAMRTGVPLSWLEAGTEPTSPKPPTGLPADRQAALAELAARKRTTNRGGNTGRYLLPAA